MQASSETQSVTSSSGTTRNGNTVSKSGNGTEQNTNTALIAQWVVDCLENHKAEDIIQIDLSGKSSIADFMIIASGRSQRQVAALCDYVVKSLKSNDIRELSIQGRDQADWILIDSGDVIIHIFRPEVRSFYNLEKMWLPELVDGDEHKEEEQVLN